MRGFIHITKSGKTLSLTMKSNHYVYETFTYFKFTKTPAVNIERNGKLTLGKVD